MTRQNIHLIFYLEFTDLGLFIGNLLNKDDLIGICNKPNSHGLTFYISLAKLKQKPTLY